MKRTKRILAIVLAIVLCAAVFAGCGDKGGSTPAPTAAPDKTAAPAPTNAPANTDAPPAAEEVVYNMTVSFEEAWWDPALFTQANDVGLAPMIYETLVQYNVDGSVSPQLAESWDISDDGLTYTFHLRKGVQWHKGYGEFTSADVKFTLERHGDPAVASINAGNIKLDNIDSIECPDDYTVVIKLKAIDVDLLTRLGLYYSFMVCKAHNDKDGTASINTDPIGTGPFIFDGGTLGIRTEAVANKEWWGDRKGGNIDRIVNTFMNDTNTIYAAFDAGEVDAIGVYDYDKVAEYVAAGYNHISTPYLQLLYLGVNMQLAPFDNEKVREALFYAVDVDYFLEQLYQGNEEAAQTYVPMRSKYALPNGFKSVYDPDKCKELLAEAGYPNGCEITLWGANDALGMPPAILLQDQLSKAGFKVELQAVDFGVFIGQVRGGTAQCWTLYNTTGTIADDTINRYCSDAYPGNNWCGIMDEEYDRLVAAGNAAKTEQEKYDNYYAAQRRLISLNVLYPISTYSMSSIYQKNISGMTSYGDQAFRATTIIKS